MSKIKSLVSDQKVYVEPHGHSEIKTFFDPKYDFHLHKQTKRKINGKYVTVDIRIPLNSSREIRISCGGTKRSDIPRRLKKEINCALSDEIVRTRLIDDLKEVLKGYPEDFNNVEVLKQCVSRIGKAFGFNDLEQNLNIVFSRSTNRVHKFVAEFPDEGNHIYNITLTKNRFSIEDTQRELVIDN